MKNFAFCIAHYNNSELLNRCVKSIDNITTEFNYEVIVVDDCSNIEHLKAVQKNLGDRNDVKVLTNSRNMGVSYTKNKCFFNSNAEYCVFIDCDDYFDEHLGRDLLAEVYRSGSASVVMLSHCLYTNNSVYNEQAADISLKDYVSKGSGEEALVIINKKISSMRPFYGQLRGSEGLGLFRLLKKHNTNAKLLQTRARYYTSDSSIQLSSKKSYFKRAYFLKLTHVITLEKYKDYISLSRKIRLYALIFFYKFLSLNND